MNYYKHTSGESFTLDGIPYYGFFHVKDGTVYTGKLSSLETVKLTPRNTFMADCYLRKLQFDNAYLNITPIYSPKISPTEPFNFENIKKITNQWHYNNLICYSSGIINKPFIYTFNSNNDHYYASTSENGEMEARTGLSDIETLQNNTKWKFLNSIITGDFLVNKDGEFKYFCSTGFTDYILAGSFTDRRPLSIFKKTENFVPTRNKNIDKTYGIYHDQSENKLYVVKSDTINVYDTTLFYNCNELFLIDTINLKPSTRIDNYWNNREIDTFSSTKVKYDDHFQLINVNPFPELVKFGNNLRTIVQQNKILLYNKEFKNLENTIELSDYNITTNDILDISIRTTDDLIGILYRKNEKLYILIIDPTTNTKIKQSELKSIRSDLDRYKLKFSDYDSNIFNVSNKKEYQARFITYPTYPHGRLEKGYLCYYEKYKWDTAYEFFNRTLIQYYDLDNGPNTYNNILPCEVVRNNKMYMLLLNNGRLYAISQPLNDRFTKNINLNVSKNFEPIKCAYSSIGLTTNILISNLIKDTLKIHNKTSEKFIFRENYPISTTISNIYIIPDNLYINGNEPINATTVSRIIELIGNTQTNLLPTT